MATVSFKQFQNDGNGLSGWVAKETFKPVQNGGNGLSRWVAKGTFKLVPNDCNGLIGSVARVTFKPVQNDGNVLPEKVFTERSVFGRPGSIQTCAYGNSISERNSMESCILCAEVTYLN